MKKLFQKKSVSKDQECQTIEARDISLSESITNIDKIETTAKKVKAKHFRKASELIEKYKSKFKSSGPSTPEKELLVYADCRCFEEKKNEINDNVLIKYLSDSTSSKRRRNATCEKIDKLERNSELLKYMENLLHDDYVNQVFLL
jgi:hypothetical protein